MREERTVSVKMLVVLMIVDIVLWYQTGHYEKLYRLAMLCLLFNRFSETLKEYESDFFGKWFERAMKMMFMGDQIIMFAAYKQNEELFEYCILFYFLGHCLLILCYYHNIKSTKIYYQNLSTFTQCLLILAIIIFDINFYHQMVHYIQSSLFNKIMPYTIFLSIFLIMTVLRSNYTNYYSAIYAILGSIVFAISDFCIAAMLFLFQNVHWIEPLALFTYYIAILLIIQSAIYHVRQFSIKIKQIKTQ